MNRSFFVGYLPIPADIRKFVIGIIVVLVIVAAAVAVTVGSNQQAAGTGNWNPTAQVTMTGRLVVDPYPILYREDGKSVVLVVQGKRSADEYSMPHAGVNVEVTGYSIKRGNWSMLEIVDAESIQPKKGTAPVLPAVEQLGKVSLQGEVVDSKCFLGVMKPGEGKVHRACAALCLLGGIPPMFVVKSADGNRYGYVMTRKDGSHASRMLASMVAWPVSVSGMVESRGDLLYLRMDSEGVTPLVGNDLLQFGDSLAASAVAGEFCGVRRSAKI